MYSFKTIEEAAEYWKITDLSQLNGNWWQGYDREDERAVIRFDKEAGWAELFVFDTSMPIKHATEDET